MNYPAMKLGFILAGLCSTALIMPQAHAAGFFLQEQSVSGLGNAFAGQVATPRDASIVYFNPAGMTGLSSAEFSAGAHLIMPRSDLSNNGSTIDSNPGGGVNIVALTGNDGGNPYSPEPIPNLHIAYPLMDKRVWVGFSSSAPFGLSNEYNEDWFGRFDSTKTELTVLDFAPSIAVAVNDWLSVGGGLNVQYASANLESAVRATSNGTSNLNGEDWSAGYNIGFLITPDDKTTLGLHYRSGVKHTLDGRFSIIGSGGADQNVEASADLDLPDILQIGINHKVNDKLSLQGGATWYGWNSFDTIKVMGNTDNVISDTKQNYQTTWAFAVGAEYDLNDDWTLRAGYQFDQTPTTDEYRTSRTPDGDRNWFSAGATYHYNEKISLDMAVTYIDVAEGTINVDRNIPSANANVRAETEGQVGIFALGVNYKF